MIRIEVSGLERYFKILHWLDPETIRIDVSIRIIEDEVDKIIQMIRQDPNIPKEYKDALITWSSESTGEVFLAVYWPEKYKMKKFGRYIVWRKYRCPIRKYWGGELTPAYTGPDYLMELWNRIKGQVIKNIKERILNYIRTGLR